MAGQGGLFVEHQILRRPEPVAGVTLRVDPARALDLGDRVAGRGDQALAEGDGGAGLTGEVLGGLLLADALDELLATGGEVGVGLLGRGGGAGDAGLDLRGGLVAQRLHAGARRADALDREVGGAEGGVRVVGDDLLDGGGDGHGGAPCWCDQDVVFVERDVALEVRVALVRFRGVVVRFFGVVDEGVASRERAAADCSGRGGAGAAAGDPTKES